MRQCIYCFKRIWWWQHYGWFSVNYRRVFFHRSCVHPGHRP